MAKFKIEIDRDACIGDGACCEEAPNTFELDDESIAVVTDPEGHSSEEIMNAAQSCPTDAIILTDSESGEQVWPE